MSKYFWVGLIILICIYFVRLLIEELNNTQEQDSWTDEEIELTKNKRRKNEK